MSPSVAKLLLYSWLFGVGLLSVRLSFGLWTARRLTRLSVREPRLEVLSNAERLMAALNITGAVTVLESALVKVPTAMGWLKPVVLLPAQAMTGLSMAQIDALIAHELAHIKRHDYLVNLLQSAIETLLFYHPAVWLISRSVRHERELCCDDMAIAACGDDRLTYASALADLESLRQVPEPMLAANGGSLLTRVRRILAPDDVQTVRGRGHWMAGVAILLIALIAVPLNVARARASATAKMEVVDAALGLGPGIKSMRYTQPLPAAPLASFEVALGGPSDGDQQKIAIGQIVRLEVTVNQAAAKISSRVQELAVGAAFTEWNRAKDAAERARAEADRLSKVNLKDSDAAVDAAKTVPGLSSDSIVIQYLNSIEELEKSKKRMMAENGYGTGHPRIVSANTDIMSIGRQLATRLQSLVDNARLNAEIAKASEDRFKVAYDTAARSTTSTAATTRSAELSKDYTVQEDGTILLPYAGYVKAAGITLAALQTSARTALNAQAQHVVKVLASIEARALDAPPTAPASEGSPQPVKAPEPAPPSRKMYYDNAYADYAATRYDLAIQGFQAYLGTFPNSADADKAQFQIGESYYALRRYLDAAMSYGEVIANYKTSAWAPDAYYKQALAYLELGRPDSARTNLEYVIKNFPDNRLSPLAQAKLKTLVHGSVKVQGAVNRPGNYDLTAEHMNLFDALTAAGSAQPSAGQLIRVRRPGSVDWELFTRADLVNGKLNDVTLGNGDTIDVPVAPKFYVQGFVSTPGEQQWEPNLTLERALIKAGGVTKDGAANRIEVRRKDPKTKEYKVIALDKDKMSTIILQEDIIKVPARRL